MTHQYSVSDNINYNNEFYKVLKLIKINGNNAYQTRKLIDFKYVEILESDISETSTFDVVITSLWNNFIYDGDNGKASVYIRQKIIGHFNNLNNVSFGPQNENSYRLKIGDHEWTKQKST